MLDTRFSATSQSARMVFELSGTPHYKVFTLQNPDRLIIDIETPSKTLKFLTPFKKNNVVAQFRVGRWQKIFLRVVADLKQPVKTKAFVMPARGRESARLVVDLSSKGTKKTVAASSVQQQEKPKQMVVIIDPGHGGKDPGATGLFDTEEKKVVLAIAKQLKILIDKQPGMRAVLTRNQDEFIELRGRLRVARKYKADVFISIHADAYRDRTSSGASVFALSARGASSEAARWLAERENKSELIGGVELQGKSSVLRSVLLDLSQTATIGASLQLGQSILSTLKQFAELHYDTVEQAGFVVLKSPDIPSLLIETGFISNPTEERKLKNPQYQKQIAMAVMEGLRVYFHQQPPPGSWFAMRA